MYTLRPRRAIIDDAGGGAWSMESMDGCFVDQLLLLRHGCGAVVRFCEVCGVLWLFVANRMRWVVPGKLKFFVKSFGRDHLIVSNGKTGKCHFVAAASPRCATLITLIPLICAN
jgi:hypothetical protein